MALIFFSIFYTSGKVLARDNNTPSVPVNSTNTFKVVDVKSIISALPKGDRWIKHVNEDLLKFWNMKTAIGDPVGNFPTYRCNDGSLYSKENPCPELKNADPGIVKLDREYTRAKSRQVYAYGIAFHLTGLRLLS